jgi:signal transduction histidine kinase
LIRDYLELIIASARADAGAVIQMDESNNYFSCRQSIGLSGRVFEEFKESLRPSYIGDLLAGFSNFSDDEGVVLAETDHDIRNAVDQLVLRRCTAQRMIGFGLHLESIKNPLAVILFYRDRRTKLTSDTLLEVNQRLNSMALAFDRANWEATMTKQQRSIAAGSLILGLAHEIRNYLTTFDLLNTRLTHGLRNARKNPSEIHDCLSCADQLTAEARAIRNSLDSVLELARTNHAGRTTKLIDLVKRVDLQCRETAEQDGVLFVLESSNCKEVEELVVPFSLGQVISNLVINAIQHTSCFRNTGRGWIKLQLACESNQAVMRVFDNGFGIDGADHETIFEMFHSTRTNGSGLGLYVARMIVSTLGGELVVESSYKFIGTQMKLTLPIPGATS